MAFQAPGGLDDLADDPVLRQQFFDLWNSNEREGFIGRYVAEAARRSPNYVDPRSAPPSGEPKKIPWNGFPRLISRWFDDELSTDARVKAEATADIPTPILSWVAPGRDGLQLNQLEAHRVPLFGQLAVSLARPLKRILPDNTLGDDVIHVRRQQDEYLEWHATRDDSGRLIALTFTAEPPDYWMALAQVAPDLVHELYKTLLGHPVPKDDLFHPTNLAAFGIDGNGETGWFDIGGKGTYDELNVWTTTKGIVHLTHRANTLGAEVTLAADASHVFGSDLEPPPMDPNAPVEEIRRIACGGYGGINRSSDPLIGLGVGGQVKAGARVTLTDPIGLYIANADISGLRGPNGEPIGTRARSVSRGHDDPFDPRILRFEVRLPAGTPFTLDQCKLGGRQLERGGQVARLTTMHLYAQTYPNSADPTAQACGGVVCRHPVRKDLFTIGDPAHPDGTCPANQNDRRWLRETPLEAAPAPPFAVVPVAAAAEAVGAATTLKAKLAVVHELSTSRAPRKP